MSFSNFPIENDLLDQNNRATIPVSLWFEQLTNLFTKVFTTEFGRIKGTTRVTTTYTILEADENIFCDTDGGGFTVTLPALIDGTHYKIMNTGTSGNTLTVAPNGTDLLIGVNSNSTVSDGNNLDIIGEETEGWA